MTKPGIMIVEDESLVGLDLQNRLNDMGFRVTSVHAEAQLALNSISSEKPELILMDIQLRGSMDGIDAARTIQNRYGIPVLFLTAFADSEVLNRAREVGAYGYMVKPFSTEELRGMVEIALSKHRLEKEHKQLDERLLRAQKYESLRLMAGGIAHRFNNSMQVVLGNLSLVMQDLPEGTELYSTLKNVEKGATAAALLGEQLLACSGRGFYQLREIDLSASIKKIMYPIEALLPQSMELKMEMDDDLPKVRIDIGQLEIVLTALVTNSVEAMEEQAGTIIIKTSVGSYGKTELTAARMGEFLPEGPYVCLSVADTGCGMTGETTKKIFDPFFSTKFTGRGLGMATTLGVIHAHNGTIRVESELGTGSKIEILLPVAVTEDI